MKIKLVGDGSIAGTEVVCEQTGTPMAGAELKWMRITASLLEVEISVSRFFIEVSTHGTIPTLRPRQPPVVRPYFVVKLVGDGSFDFTMVCAHDTDDEISVREAFFRVEEGQTKPSLVLVLANPTCQFTAKPSLVPSTVTGSTSTTASFIPPGQVLTAPGNGISPSYTNFGPGNVHVPGAFPNGVPSNQDDPQDAASSFGCKHEYVQVQLFTSTIEVCKLCKKEKP